MEELNEVVKELSLKYDKKEIVIKTMFSKYLELEDEKENFIKDIEEFYKFKNN